MYVKYLFVGAHPDDIEIGAGAVLLKLLHERQEVHYATMTMCSDIPRNVTLPDEHKQVMREYEKLGRRRFSYTACDYTNRDLRRDHMEIRAKLEEIRDSFKPNIIFAPSMKDIHQDHSYVGEEVLRVFRYQTVLFYEVPRSSLNFLPKMYVQVNEDHIDQAIDIIAIYKSQSTMKYMTKDVIISMFKHRGNENGVEYAQAFEVQRVSI